MESGIDVADLVVRRGRREVLHGLSARMPAAQVTGVLGPSGSGKTTLLRALVGVQQVQRGRVSVAELPAGAPALRHRIGYVTQAPSVYFDLTVAENLAYFGRLYGRPDRRAADTVAAQSALGSGPLAQVGLVGAADQLVGELSGGQRSRASLACALVGDPDVLVLDEPTVGQDPVLREELWGHFRALAESGVTLVVSSHVMDEANRCDRLLLVRDGYLVADDTPDAVRARSGTEDLDEAFLRIVRGQEVSR